MDETNAMWERFSLTRAAVEADEQHLDDEDEPEPRVGNRLLRMYAEQGRVVEIAEGVYMAGKLGPRPPIG